MKWTYSENRKAIVLERVPIARKKVTATRLAGILSLNDWVTDFQMWCEITKAATLPFEDNKYTLAGKAIEPKLIQYTRDNIFDLDPENVKDPEEYWGNIYRDVKYDFFKDTKVFGGMWDAVHLDDDGKIDTIIECKTSSRPQDWTNGVPVYYKVQGLLYAHLTGAKKLYFPVSFLKDEDYARPEEFRCTADNTTIIEVPVNSKITWRGQEYGIEELLTIALEWYNAYVETGVSPEFDENKDSDYLSILRKNAPEEDLSLLAMTTQATQIEEAIKKIKEEQGINNLEKELKKLKESIKTELLNTMPENMTTNVCNNFELAKTTKFVLDEERLKEDGIYDNYLIEQTTYTLRMKKEK